MQSLATTKLSSRGQIVIPESIREQMHLHTGDQFIVMAERDVVILKMITRPDTQELVRLINSARNAAREAGLEESDITEAVSKARGRRVRN